MRGWTVQETDRLGILGKRTRGKSRRKSERADEKPVDRIEGGRTHRWNQSSVVCWDRLARWTQKNREVRRKNERNQGERRDKGVGTRGELARERWMCTEEEYSERFPVRGVAAVRKLVPQGKWYSTGALSALA